MRCDNRAFISNQQDDVIELQKNGFSGLYDCRQNGKKLRALNAPCPNWFQLSLNAKRGESFREAALFRLHASFCKRLRGFRPGQVSHPGSGRVRLLCVPRDAA